MKRLKEEMLCDLFMRMAEHIENGMDRDTALFHAANDLRMDLHRTVAQAAADALRSDITRH